MESVMFRRKVYDKLLKWKKEYAGRYACLLEGARRVGKSTIAENFAKNEYDSYIRIDFADITEEMLDVFRDIAKPDIFFLRLQAETGITLKKRKSVIIFDEIQLNPKVRQAIKYLVKDGRYDYIETGSLISIRKNVKDIVIPSEEHRIKVYPMDFEEFSWALGKDQDPLRQLFKAGIQAGNALNRSLMRDFRIYMAVGGMPQAVEAYIKSNNFKHVDSVKKEIIDLYLDDLMKLDPTGRLSAIYDSVPSQLALKKKRFIVSSATGKQKTGRDDERIFELIDSRMVIPCWHVTNPGTTLALTKEIDKFKLYLSDTGLFVTMMIAKEPEKAADIYKKFLGDKLPADLGYLYENAAAQIFASHGKELYYHTWRKENSTHCYEIDFLLSSGSKIVPVEVKSSETRNHESIDRFSEKYKQYVGRRYLFSQKDVAGDGQLQLKPVYMLPFAVEEI